MYENVYYPDYLMHYGVKGMKWGVRRTTKWATSKNQPSSVKSSVLAGAYAATGNKRIGKALDKSNDRDAENWKRAKDDYKTIKKQQADKEAVKAERNTPEAKAARRKKALKVGVAVAGTALAAYGAYKMHDFIRQKNEDIRVKQASDKCDRMLKKLDRMRVNDLVNESSASHRWINQSGRKVPFQYNNNGKNVTIPKEYRYTPSTLKRSQYRNIENKIIDKYAGAGYEQARNDSFRTAAKNVYDDYRKNRKR